MKSSFIIILANSIYIPTIFADNFFYRPLNQCKREFSYYNGKKQKDTLVSFEYLESETGMTISFQNPDGNIPSFHVTNFKKGSKIDKNILLKATFIKPGKGSHSEAVQDAKPIEIFLTSNNKAYQFDENGKLLHEYTRRKDKKGMFTPNI